jgi:copper oxidase (laccase) domain-containing protein
MLSAKYFVKTDNEYHFDIYHYNKYEVLQVGIKYTIPAIERWTSKIMQAIREEDDFLRRLLS